MHNCIILGSGRSGTSMVAGALSRSGYRMGAGQHAARASNPKGFFETPTINGINERLLAPVLRARPSLGEGQRWLGIPTAGEVPRPTPEDFIAMKAALNARPFCHKDPRFCFTLPAWRPLLQDTRFVCTFRHPALTAKSIQEECKRAAYLHGLELDPGYVFELWMAMYREVLESHATQGEWLFLHYDQALSESGIERLSGFLDAEVDASFPDSKLRRTDLELEVPPQAMELYARLCERAEYLGAAQQGRPETPRARVAVLAIVADDEQDSIPEMLEDVRAQRGVDAQLVIVDQTQSGGLVVEGARVVRCDSASRGRAWRMGLAESDADWVALLRPGCRMLPSRLAHAVEALQSDSGVQAVTCDYFLHDDEGQFMVRSSPGAMGEVPGPFWESGLVLKRERFEALGETVFFPVELELWQSLRAQGQVLNLEEAGFSVHQTHYKSGWDGSRRDGAQVALARRPQTTERPELTVSICTFNRRTVLMECLEAFSRQLLAPGTFEIVLVDDGSTDGTAEWLQGLQFPVPVHIVRRENGGLAAARNTGLEIARGRLVLFVNDDTIPSPGCVERHIRTHAELGSGVKAAVVGLFEQPQDAQANALLRYLETSAEVFAYANMKPHEFHDAFHFFTCNVSVSLDGVRQAGAFDPSFRHYGCEDTDLGFRLEDLGYRVYYEPEAHAVHRHIMDFDYIRARQQTVARAYVRFFRKHPRALAKWENEDLSASECHTRVITVEGDRQVREQAARELSAIDIGALEALGGAYRETAAGVLDQLGGLLSDLNRTWWQEGYLDGFREHALGGYQELIAGGVKPRSIERAAPRALLAWPRWDDASSLDRLMELAVPVAGQGVAALVLRHDPSSDLEIESAQAALGEAYKRRFGADVELEVILEERALDGPQLRRLGRSVDALLTLGDEPADFLKTVGAEQLCTPDQVADWQRRFGPQPLEQEPTRQLTAEAPTPEISVIIPTKDRPRELVQLLRQLADQDLARERFEVIVVDDGSRTPAREAVAGLGLNMPVHVLAQESAGPGAARNRGLVRARGKIVVFFNDDAVPATDNLRKHIAAHCQRSDAVAVMGTFRLLPALVTDSFSQYVEVSTALFAQPLMQAGVLYDGASLCTGNVSIPRACLEAAGGFDESFSFAGGEDSELGLRLEREQGLRVVFDPSVVCFHDHELDVPGFLRRQRVIGWAAYRIEAKHAAAGLVPDWPLDEAAWSELRQQVDANGVATARLVRNLDDGCRREREEGRGPKAIGSLNAVFERVQSFGFNAGLLAAHEGRMPDAPTLDAAREHAVAPAGLS